MQLKEIAPCQKELKVEIPVEAVDSEFDAVYQDLKKVARVPGFRVGRAPRDLLERYHGSKAREEVLRRLVDRSIEEALTAHRSLDLVGRPQIREVSFNPKQPLVYSALLEIAPEVPLGRYKGIPLTKEGLDISEESMARVLTHLQEQHAQLKPLLESRPAAAGDFLLVDLTEQLKGRSPVTRRDVVIPLDLEKDPEGFLKELVGLTPPATRILKLKNGTTVTVQVKQIKVKELPAIDDTFAQSVGPYETLESLKTEIRQGLEKQAVEAQRRALEGQATQHLLEEWHVDVPPFLVASHARRILKERAVDLMSQGVSASQVQERSELLASQAKLDALKAVKLFFILRRIATAEGMTATAQEVEARIKILAERLQSPPEQVRKDLETKDLLEEVAWGIIRGKVMDLIIQTAEIKKSAAGEIA